MRSEARTRCSAIWPSETEFFEEISSKREAHEQSREARRTGKLFHSHRGSIQVALGSLKLNEK